MAYVNDSALDAALDNIKNATRLLLCSSEPADYSAAVAAQLAYSDSLAFGSNADYAGGRQTTISAITDGVGTADGTVMYYALVDVSGTTLYATQSVSSSFAVTNGQTGIEIDSFVIQNPDVA